MERSQPERLYPEHLYDPLRRQIAVELLEKEFNKQLHDAATAPVDAKKWAARFDEHTFWNALEGFMGGTLIKPIVHFLTARNYQWSARKLAATDIQLSSKLDQLERLGELDPHKLYLKDIAELLAQNPKEAATQRTINDHYSQHPAQDLYKPLVVEKDGHPMVMDGNRRCLRAVLYSQEMVEVWYCQTNDEKPIDFWFPIDDMMDLVRIYNNGKDTQPELKHTVQAILQEVFRQSQVAEIAYRQRIIGAGTKGAAELLTF